MHIKTFIFSMLFIFSASVAAMSRSASHQTPAHVQAVLGNAYKTAATAPALNTPPMSASLAQAYATSNTNYPPPPTYSVPRPTPSVVHHVYHPPIIHTRPAYPVPVYLPTRTHETVIITQPNAAQETPVEVTTGAAENPKKSWWTPTKMILAISGVGIVTYMIYKMSQNKNQAIETIPMPAPIVTPVTPMQTAWDSAYLRLTQEQKTIIDSLELHKQYPQYAGTLKGTLREKQEINAVTTSANPVDKIYAAQTEFVQCYLAYEQEQSNTALAQSVVTTHQRLLILYNNFKNR